MNLTSMIFNREQKQTKTKLCFGFVPFVITKNEIEVLLVRSRHGFWGTPKGGWKKSDKDGLSTAFREFQEETGLLYDKTHENVKHVFLNDGINFEYKVNNVQKKSTLFPMLLKSKPKNVEFSYDANETCAHLWCKCEDMVNFFAFAEDREMAKVASKLLPTLNVEKQELAIEQLENIQGEIEQ